MQYVVESGNCRVMCHVLKDSSRQCRAVSLTFDAAVVGRMRELAQRFVHVSQGHCSAPARRQLFTRMRLFTVSILRLGVVEDADGQPSGVTCCVDYDYLSPADKR